MAMEIGIDSLSTSSMMERDFAPRITSQNKPLRVLHIINGEHYAGAERVQDLLARELPGFGVEVEFALLKPGKFIECCHTEEVSHQVVPMRSRFDIKPASRICEYVKKQKIDLLHTHSTRSALIGRVVSMRTGLPVVHHVHSPTTRDTEKWLSNQLNAFVERGSIRKAVAVIAVSESMARYIHKRGIEKNRIFTVANGVPTPGPLVERALPTSPWQIGMTALFRPRKGIEVLLHALAGSVRSGANVQLRAIGEFDSKPYQDEVLRLVDDLGLQSNVHWLGYCQDVNSQLRNLDMLVVPSMYGEGLPMVVLEAMAMGVPVIASNVEGITEALRHEVDGLIVPPNDPDALAASICQVISGKVDWSMLRTNAYHRQCECFSDHRMASRVADVYRHILA